jgi:inosose dehydratase
VIPTLRVGNAPCSWGTLEFAETKAEQIGFRQMLDELVETGYTGTELGNWGYMPTDPAVLGCELKKRGLIMLGAFVPVALKEPAAHEAGIAAAVKTARLLAAVAGDPPPYLVLADANGTSPERTANAGRITEAMGLTPAEWKIFAEGANKIALTVRDQTGLRTVFHHHSAGYVERPEEIARFLELTDPDLVGLAFDTGHYAFGAADFDVVSGLERFRRRVWYVHFKDFRPEVAACAGKLHWDYFESLRHGVFCELGRGCIDFAGVLRWLKNNRYRDYVLVEQDVLPGMGTPRESARRNREYLHSLESNYA